MCALSGAAFANDVRLGVDARAFSNFEGLTYLNVFAGTSLCGCNDLWLQLNGTFSKRTVFSRGAVTISHGGSDVELLGTYAPKNFPVSLSLGAAIPDTASRTDETDVTYRAAYYVIRRPDAEVAVESYGAATVSPLLIAGVSGSYQFGRTKLFGSVGAPFRGNNSISITTGQPNRVGLFTVGAEWKIGAIKGDALSISVTNQLGWTTGMAATPALGGNPGLAVSYTVRF